MSDPTTAWQGDNQYAVKAREMATGRDESESAAIYFTLGYMAGTFDGMADVEAMLDRKLAARNPADTTAPKA